MLSNSQGRYLEDIKKGTKIKSSPQVQRNLRWQIRKKYRQPMKDLALIFEALTPTELKFNKEDYWNLAVPLMQAIQSFEHKAHFITIIHDTALSDALEKAGKRHDYRRLTIDEKYKQRMIDWAVKNGIELYSLPSLEKIKEIAQKLAKA